MTDELKIMLDNESLGTLLRSNLSCYLGKTITQDVLNDITGQIIDSIDYFLNKKNEIL
jgi:hypothetical protein